jgi:hypothetical protein
MSVNLKNLLVKGDDEQLMAMFTPAAESPNNPTLEDAKEWMIDQIAARGVFYPVNNFCGNPCMNSSTCAGFDYVEHGCPGFEIEP